MMSKKRATYINVGGVWGGFYTVTAAYQQGGYKTIIINKGAGPSCWNNIYMHRWIMI